MATPRPAFGLTKQIIITTKQSRIDWHYGTWATLAIALENIVPNIRKKGKLFGVVNEDPNSREPVIEYWFRDGIEDADAVLYTPEVGVNTDSSQIGEVTVNSVTSEVNIALHPSGVNFVMLNGVKVTKTVAEAPIAFIPVTEGKLKSIIIYGKTDAQMIYVAEGIEGVEAIDPDYDGLLIKRIVAKSTGVVIVPAVDGFVKLIGTEVGKPITGDLEIFTASGETKGLKSRVNGTPYYSYVGFDDDGSPLLEYTSFTGYYNRLNLYNNSLILGSDDPNFRGIDGLEYYGNTIGDTYFAQQKYVNDKIASITVDLTAYYTRTEVDSLLTSTYKAKGSVSNFSSLPTTGQREGDVWNTIDTGDNYVWVLNLNNTGNAGWDKLGGLVDLTAYQTTLAADSKYQLKGAYLLAADIANKVDKITGKSLILDTEITRLAGVTNQDISVKVDKVTGEGLIATTEKNRLASVFNLNTSSLVDKMGMYWDATAGKLISNAVEYLGVGWLKLKVITFGGYTIAQRNALVVEEGTVIYVNETPKGLQEFRNGSWSQLNRNIGNTDLGNLVTRTFLQGADYVHNTAGNKYYLSGLLDKTNQAAYSKVVIVHPTTGETVTRDFADPSATTLAVQNATTTQKSAMRVALLGNAVPASPVVNQVNSFFIKKGTDTLSFMSGINLTPLDPTSIWIETSEGIKVFATNYYVVSNTVWQVFWKIPESFPSGTYEVRVMLGSVLQGSSKGFVQVVEKTTDLSYDITSSNSVVAFRPDYTTNVNKTRLLSPNNLKVLKKTSNAPGSDMGLENVFKTDNVFLGRLKSSWEIILDINPITLNSTGGQTMDFAIITETTNSQLSSTANLVINKALFRSTISSTLSDMLNRTIINAWVRGKVIIKKSGNIICAYRLEDNGAVSFYLEWTIDITKDYGFAIINYNTTDILSGEWDINITANILNLP